MQIDNVEKFDVNLFIRVLELFKWEKDFDSIFFGRKDVLTFKKEHYSMFVCLNDYVADFSFRNRMALLNFLHIENLEFKVTFEKVRGFESFRIKNVDEQLLELLNKN